MGLFSLSQMEEINKVAEQSKQALSPPKSSKKASSIVDTLNEITKEVTEYFKDSNARLITTKEELHDYVTKFIDFGIGGIDTETTGLDRIKDTIVGASLYYPGEPEVYIPMKHLVPIFDVPYKNQLTYEEVGEELSRITRSNTKLIFANADFDLAMIYKDLKVDLNKNCFFDVILAWRCLKENEKDNALKVLYNKYVLHGKGEPKKFSDFFPPELFPYCKPEVAGLYAANDAKITYELFEFESKYLDKNSKACQKNHLERISDIVYGIEMPLIDVCQNMHRIGVYLDKDIAAVLQKRYRDLDVKERKKLSEMVDQVMEENSVRIMSSKTKKPFVSGKDFNPTSPIHTKYLVYTVLNAPPDKDGKLSTDKSVLSELNIPVVNQILKVRSIGVLISTFVEKLPSSTTSDNRVHARFNQLGARCITGDSIIPTSNGYRTLGDICESYGCSNGVQVDVDGLTIINKDQVCEDSTMVVKYEDRPTIKITTEYGFTIEGTHDHPVMISKYNSGSLIKKGSQNLTNFWNDRYFKPLGNICVGDYIEIPCNYSDQIKPEYQPSNLKLVPYKYKGKKLTAKLPETVDEKFALFLGMYHADGGARFREGTYNIRISNDNPEVIELTRTLCESLFNLPISVSLDSRHNGGESSVTSTQISSIDAMLSHGKQYKKIPEVIYRSPVSVINSYIKGMTLDSTVYKEPSGRLRFSITVCDYNDVRFLQTHLVSQGILSSIKFERMCGGGIEHRLMFNADNYILFRDLIGFIESKKYVYDVKPCSKNGYDVRRIGNSFRVMVKKIEQSRNTVYDLHIPDTHSFISNGMISHNTGRLSSADPKNKAYWGRKIRLTHGRAFA